MLIPVKLNSFTNLRALLVLHDRGMGILYPPIPGVNFDIFSCCFVDVFLRLRFCVRGCHVRRWR
jgi:hypothetical protein